MDKAILFTLSDIDKSSIDSRQNIFYGSEVDVADLVAALGNDQLIDTLFIEHCGDSQLLSDDDLMGHGEERICRGPNRLDDGGGVKGGRWNDPAGC
jgi:hypothetical protein